MTTMTATHRRNGSTTYWIVTITNAAKHISAFDRWRVIEHDDGSLELRQVLWPEVRQIIEMVDRMNKASKTLNRESSKPSARRIELLSVAERDGLNHGRAWYCSDRDIETKGINPMHEGELICYVYS